MCGFGTDDCGYGAGTYRKRLRTGCGPLVGKNKKKTGVLDTWQITANQE